MSITTEYLLKLGGRVEGKLHLHSRITHKLLISLVIILFASLVIAALYFDSSNRFKAHAKQSELVHAVLTKYSEIALFSFEKLVAMGDIIRTGSVATPQIRIENESKLRQSLFEVRKNLLEKIAITDQLDTTKELITLDRITQKVERIITTSQEIRALVDQEQFNDARHLYQLIEKQGVHADFNRLISEAVAEEQRQAVLIRENTQALSERNNRLLAAALALMSLFTMASIWFFWQRINKATTELHYATTEFTAGQLEHRIPMQQDLEFEELAKALNAMAGQLAKQRMELNLANESLEEKVTERTKALELSNQKLALVDRQRRQFLADIGHELRTPLTIIRGEAEVSLRSNSMAVSDYQGVLEAIVDEVGHTTALIEDLMLVARSSAGELRLNSSEFNLTKTVSELCELYSRKADDKQQVLRFECESNCLLVGDERRLRQVAMILLENALGYSSAGATTDVKLMQRNQMLILKVIDMGVGIKEYEQEQVFERFYRSNRAKIPGSGLGLPVAKAIVSAHGGHISLKPNQSVKGATATVLLPLVREETHENIIS